MKFTTRVELYVEMSKLKNEKMRLFLVAMLFFSLNIYSQNSDKYDILLEKLKIREQTDIILNQITDDMAKQKPVVPVEIWKNVKVNLSATYLSELKMVFKENYTMNEINDLVISIDRYGLHAYKPKPEVTKKIYEIGKRFGSSLRREIQKELSSLGYK
ncbi:hypothetical protein [Flavobacterium sp. UBA7682]|uniref:hypothetical protein n=1 Tax=Flavobacterium sp. UBA7682 TaxID=1946560 RepID=UPI0025C6BF02|nr:hypothetical protein [Flavobacterium sp. UBA7682]